jgi:hypothetical protein
MPSQALVIGLGGTGTLVATYVKKDLLETLKGEWPPKEVRVLAFDTDTKKPEIGNICLEKGEFCFIGGNVQGLMREVAAGKHPHLRNWLLADWYLGTAKLADKAYNLNEGAGQFRQFGRLTVFKDVATPSTSNLYSTLHDALTKIRLYNPLMKSLQVFIIASLAGGTGAGMYADVAHLIRKIAEQPDINLKKQMSIRGYLVLPDAFSRTVDQAWLGSMYARAFAAMRENRRFAVSFDYARGYPIHYHAGAGHPIWHGAIKGKLFDLLYYFDGQGQRNQIGSVKLEYGVAPAIADAISAAIDKEAGATFASYVANVEMERTSRVLRGDLSPKTATFGSMGTFTVVFPLSHIVRGWVHKMGLDVLNHLLMPSEYDARSGNPIKLEAKANQENPGVDGEAAARDFLKGTKPVVYSSRKDNKLETLQVEPTLLLGELGRISDLAARPGSAVSQELANRSIVDWNPFFIPRGDDKETQRLLQRIESIISLRLYDREGKLGQVLTSDQKKPREDPIMGCESIISEVRIFKNRHLGDEDTRTGQRTGGVYRNSLASVVEHQMTRFSLCLDYYLQSVLNGSPNRASLEAKGGKLGFLQEFLDALFQSLERSRTTLLRVQQIRRDLGESRRNAIAATQTAMQTMKASANKKGLGGPSRDAFQSQHNYLQSETRLVEILQAEAAEEAILDVVGRMTDYVRSAQQAIEDWLGLLATKSDSLYAQLLRGKKQAESDRLAEQDIKCRFVINDKKYEDMRYEAYVSAEGGWLNTLLSTLEWQFQTKLNKGRPQIVLNLLINQADKPKTLGKDSSDDLKAWLQFCSQPFASAPDNESVIGYLLQDAKYGDPTKLAEIIFNNSGVSLNFEGGDPLPANFLRAYHNTEEQAGHVSYLRSVIQNLAQASGKSTLETSVDDKGQETTQESRFMQFVNSEDRFKFTLVFTQEMLELERIAAYNTSGDQAYMGGEDRVTRGDRRALHVFPAEVHAAEYEARLPEIKQQIRLFSDDVALQLEDLEQFKLFLLCYAYQMIKRGSVKNEKLGTLQNNWQLHIAPAHATDKQGKPVQPDIIWLTDPTKPPSLHDAMMTFNFIGKDIGHGQGYERVIDYEAVSAALVREREKDAQRRVSQGIAGQGDPLREQLNSVSDVQLRQKLLLDLGRIDQLQERRDHIEKNILVDARKYLGNTDLQKEYDIASIFTLMLGDEIAIVRQTIKDSIRSTTPYITKNVPEVTSSEESETDKW